MAWIGFKDRGVPLSEGAKLPHVQIRNNEDHLFFIDDFGRKGWLLVYFYPKADTPGCTAQACSLRDHFEDLTHQGVRILGVSKDKPKTLQKFKAKYSLPFDLVSDHEGKLCQAFGVPTWFGFSSRQAYLFRNGKLVWRDLVGSTQRQADDILRVLRERS